MRFICMKERKIKIIQILNKMNYGGIEQVVLNYCQNINKNKIIFDFICEENSTNIPYDLIKKWGGKVYLVPPIYKFFKYKKELTKIFIKNKYDIAHSHLNTLSVFPLKIAKKCNIKIRIAHAHTTSSKKLVIKNIINKILKKFSTKYANVYYACSRAAGDYLFGSNYEIINNAIDVKKFKFNKQKRLKIRKKLKISDDTFVVGHIGRFAKQKNHEFVIETFNNLLKKNSNCVLILIGDGPKLRKIKKLIKLKKMDNKVIFLKNQNNINEFYSAFDILLLPSYYEGFPLVLVEAQAACLNVIASPYITTEAKLSNFISFEKLNVNLWIQKIILEQNNFNKPSSLINNYYDINKEAKKLENKYLNFFKKDKISIIIPVYNKEKYLKKCLKSILNQTYKNLEIIIIDDKSTDKSLEIINSFKNTDKRIKVYTHKHSNISSIRNYGLKKVTGSYVLFIDSDDYIEKNMIEILYENLKIAHADISICNYNNKDSEKNFIFDSNTALNLLFNNKRGIGFGLWNKLISKDILTNQKFNNYKIGEDLDFTYRLLKKSNLKITYIDKTLYHYIKRTNSITNIISLKDAKDKIKIVSKIFKNNKNINNDLIVYKINEYVSLYNVMIRTNTFDYTLIKKAKKLYKGNILKIINSNYPINKKLQLILFKLNKKIYLKLYKKYFDISYYL